MARYRKRARAQAIATTPEAAKPSSSKICKRSHFDGLDDEILAKIIGKLGDGLYLGSVPHLPAALVPVPKQCPADAQTEISCTPTLIARSSSQDLTRTSCSHFHTHYPDEDAAKDCDSFHAGAALQAIACLNRRFRQLIFNQCSTCVCTVPTLIPHAVRNMASHLTRLDLHHCGGLLHDHQCEPLKQLSNLQRLNLSNCYYLTAVALTYLSKATQLTWLDLSSCRAMSPSGFKFLPVSLLHLDLSHMVGHHTPLMTHLGRLKRLQHLDLTGNETMNTGLRGLEELRALTWLSLADSDSVTSSDMPVVACLRRLRHLDLSNACLSAASLLHLSSLPDLSSVAIDGCARVTQGAVDIVRARSGAPAWDTVAVAAANHATVDPAAVTLTAEAEAPAVTAIQRRGRRSVCKGPRHSGGVRSSGSDHTTAMRVWPLSA